MGTIIQCIIIQCSSFSCIINVTITEKVEEAHKICD